jgi:fatty acid-binding protein DegV
MVAVVADSACNLPNALARDHAIAIVPMSLTVGGRSYRDGVDLSPAELYERLASDDEPATT